MMTLWHGNSSGLLALCEGNHRWPVDCPRKGPVPSVIGRSPLQRASDAEHWWFHLCKPEHTVTNMQWSWRSRIWDAWRPLWRRCYGTCQLVFSLWSRHLCARPDVYAVNRISDDYVALSVLLYRREFHGLLWNTETQLRLFVIRN